MTGKLEGNGINNGERVTTIKSSSDSPPSHHSTDGRRSGRHRAVAAPEAQPCTSEDDEAGDTAGAARGSCSSRLAAGIIDGAVAEEKSEETLYFSSRTRRGRGDGVHGEEPDRTPQAACAGRDRFLLRRLRRRRRWRAAGFMRGRSRRACRRGASWRHHRRDAEAHSVSVAPDVAALGEASWRRRQPRPTSSCACTACRSTTPARRARSWILRSAARSRSRTILATHRRRLRWRQRIIPPRRSKEAAPSWSSLTTLQGTSTSAPGRETTAEQRHQSSTPYTFIYPAQDMFPGVTQFR